VTEYLRVFCHVGFFCSWRQETFVTKGEEPLAGTVPVGKKANRWFLFQGGHAMLVLSRKPGESIVIGNDITVTVVG